MDHEAAPSERDSERDNWRSNLFQVLVVVPVVVYLAVALPEQRDELLQLSVLLFILTVAVVDLIPVPAWGGMQLSLSFPILLGVAIIYPPPVAAVIAFAGSFEERTGPWVCVNVGLFSSPDLAVPTSMVVAAWGCVLLLVPSGIAGGLALRSLLVAAGKGADRDPARRGPCLSRVVGLAGGADRPPRGAPGWGQVLLVAATVLALVFLVEVASRLVPAVGDLFGRFPTTIIVLVVGTLIVLLQLLRRGPRA
jgi:hypothetical protein